MVAADGARVTAVALACCAVGGGDEVGPDLLGECWCQLRGNGHPAQREGFEGQAIGIAVVFGLAADFRDDFCGWIEEDFYYAVEDALERC